MSENIRYMDLTHFSVPYRRGTNDYENCLIKRNERLEDALREAIEQNSSLRKTNKAMSWAFLIFLISSIAMFAL